ncbi:unnamed protein product, partial [Symbiodinium sp. KB8]
KEPFGRQLVRQMLGHPRLMFDALMQVYSKHKDKPPRTPLAWNQFQLNIVAYAKLGDRKALDSIEVARWYSPLRSTTQSQLEDLCLRGGLPNIIVTSTQNDLTPLEYVESFADVEAVLESLKSGKIVVSKLRNEPGIEYLIPWMVPNQDDRRRIRDLKPPCNKTELASLLVLGIQTKCVGSYVPKWASVAKSAQDALAGFQNHPDVLGALPVFYTTEIRVKTRPKNLEIPSIYFNEVGLAKLLLQRTGPLRLFFLKPGAPLGKMLPDFFESKRSALHA